MIEKLTPHDTPLEDEAEGEPDLDAVECETDLDYRPRTEFGRQLLELRARIVASGAKLLTWEELEREIAERRGSRAWPGE